MLERVAHFSILTKLGQGGMGVVFKAQDTKLRRAVALKLLPPEHVGDAERRARFMREARSAAAVTHPNIATIYEIGEDDAGRIFIAMELVDGQSLRDKLRSGPLVLREALTIARQIARGLAKAHDVGLVHRDLKPDNVMLTSDGEAKILDFGLAKARDEATPSLLAEAVTGEVEMPVTAAGVIVGTPGYMSPEQATGKPVDARTDLFAVGVMLFEMLTGKLPFRGATVGELLIATARDEPRRLADYSSNASPELVALVERLLAKEPDSRPADARSLIAWLDAIPADAAFARTERVAVSDPPPANAATNDIASAKTEPALPSAPPRKRSRYSFFAALIVIAAGIVVVALGVFVRKRPAAANDVGIGLLDLPVPNCNDAAKVEYRAALEAIHGRGAGFGHAGFERAAKADPNCAEAYVRAMIDNPGTGAAGENYNHASLLRQRLNPRDQAILDAYTPFYAEEPPNYRESFRRLMELSKSRPRDADLLVQLGFFLWTRDPNNELPDVARRAVEIDPDYTTAWLLVGMGRMKSGDETGAQDAYDHCEQTIPTSVDCVEEAAHHAQWIGRCAAMEAHARTLTVRTPNKKGDAYLLLASALASNTGDRVAASEALQQYSASLEPAQAYRVELEEARLALGFGDFDAAAKLLASVEEKIKPSHGRAIHAAVAELRFELALELDRPADALAIAQDFAARQSAWNGPLDEFYGSVEHGFQLVPRMLALQAKAGKITPERREKELAAWLEKNDTVHDDLLRWVAQSATSVETKEDAERALAVMPVPDAAGPKIAPLRGYSSAMKGRVLALGGRTQEGIGELRSFTSRCDRLDNPIIQTQAYAWLGEAEEAAGAKTEACAAYAVVTSRWKAPSRTAIRATERMKALGCPAP